MYSKALLGTSLCGTYVALTTMVSYRRWRVLYYSVLGRAKLSCEIKWECRVMDLGDDWDQNKKPKVEDIPRSIIARSCLYWLYWGIPAHHRKADRIRLRSSLRSFSRILAWSEPIWWYAPQWTRYGITERRRSAWQCRTPSVPLYIPTEYPVDLRATVFTEILICVGSMVLHQFHDAHPVESFRLQAYHTPVLILAYNSHFGGVLALPSYKSSVSLGTKLSSSISHDSFVHLRSVCQENISRRLIYVHCLYKASICACIRDSSIRAESPFPHVLSCTHSHNKSNPYFDDRGLSLWKRISLSR